MRDEKDTELVKGSRCSVRFGKTEEVSGVFKGYSMIGSETAVVIDCDGTVQFIMASHITSIKIIEPANSEIKKKKDEPGVYYG
ncbi:MAG: hypothetical protein FWD37_06040 [Methanomassiliicoccaceae archaeon]|nr:hypothetical protein [Methanomassiliicoccaceae archaeon]